MKRAFTIVEMMMVVAIIAILMTLIFRGVSASLAEARARRADAICRAVQAGLHAYHAQYDEWPDQLGKYVRDEDIPDRRNQLGPYQTHDPNKLELTGEEVRGLVKALVDEARRGNPLMDISGLFVSRDAGESGTGYGLDFMSAVRGTSRSRRKMKTGEMHFGYPDAASGRFRRLKMIYSIPTDSLSVGQ